MKITLLISDLQNNIIIKINNKNLVSKQIRRHELYNKWVKWINQIVSIVLVLVCTYKKYKE